MSLIDWITSGPRAAEKTLDSIIKGGDALILTKEEKIQYNASAQKLWLELQKTLASESTPRSVNRRFVAWSVILMVSLITLICVGAILLGKQEIAEDIVLLAKGLWWGEAFVAVIVFYFGPHVAAAIK